MSSNISYDNETGSSAAAITEKNLNQDAAINEADVSSKIHYMDSSLYIAAAEGKTEILENRKGELGLLTRNGNSVLHIYIAGPSPTSTTVKKILGMCPELLTKINMQGESLLHIAARYGRSAIVQYLIECLKDIESGVGAVKMTDKKKDTALHEATRQATRKDYLSVVKILIKADPDFSYSANNAEETPLYLAAEKGNSDMVSEILSTCKSPAHGGPNGKTALHAAVIGNHRGVTKIILQKEKTLAREVDRQGWTPLHYAAYFGYTEIACDLFECDKSIAFYADKNEKRIAIHIAARRGFHDTMKVIMDSSLDCCELVDKKSQNILHLAVQSKNEKTVEVILDNLSLKYLLNQKDDEGNTPLHLCAASAFYVSSLIEHPGVDKMAFNQKNLTALNIIRTNNKFCLMRRQFIKDLKKIDYKRCRRNSISNYVSKSENSDIKEHRFLDLEKAKEYHLVVAALIATVTFTAAFTLPGGLISNDGPNPGSAILTKKSSFKAFVIFDTIAMVCSTSAVLIHFFLVLQKAKTRLLWYFVIAFLLTMVAMGAMILAFVTGTYAVLEHSVGLAVSTCIIGLLFSVVVFYVLLRKRFK